MILQNFKQIKNKNKNLPKRKIWDSRTRKNVLFCIFSHCLTAYLLMQELLLNTHLNTWKLGGLDLLSYRQVSQNLLE